MYYNLGNRSSLMETVHVKSMSVLDYASDSLAITPMKVQHPY